MKFTAPVSTLSKTIGSLAPIAKSRVKPIIEHVHISASGNHVDFSVTNFEQSATCRVPAQVDKPGIAVIRASQLDSTLKVLTGELASIEVNGKATLTSGRSEFKWETMNPDEFPIIGWGVTGPSYKISGEQFHRAIRLTVPAVNETNAKIVTGALGLVNYGNMFACVAFDGSRLSLYNLGVQSDKISRLIPLSSAPHIRRLFSDDECEVSCGENQVEVSQGNMRFQTALLGGRYPAFEQIIPKRDRFAEVKTEDLLDALRQVRLALSEDSLAVHLRLSDALTFEAGKADKVTTSIPVENPHESEAWINGIYFYQWVTELPKESSVRIFFDDDFQSILCTSGEATFVLAQMGKD